MKQIILFTLLLLFSGMIHSQEKLNKLYNYTDMKIDVNNITLNYIKEGNGNPLILLHGNGEDHHIFDKLIDSLKTDYTVYAIDSRNHGESSKTNDFTYEVMAEDIFQFIQKLELRNVSIVGFSDGAILGLLLSIKHEGLFEKMVLLGVNLKPTDFKEEIYNYLLEEYAKKQDPLVRMMLEQPNIDLEELKNIQTRTLIVAGEDDLFTPESFEKIEKTMPHSEFKIMKGHSHDNYVVNEDILYPYLKEFLAK